MDETVTAGPPAPDAGPGQGYLPGVTPELPEDPAARRRFLELTGVPAEMQDRMGPLGFSPLAAKMGLRFTHLSVDLVTATVPVAGNEQNMGLFHGGAHLVIAETLGSIAAMLHADGRPVVGIEIGATHHRAARSGTVTGTCRPVHLGGTLTTHEVVMTDDEDRRLSTARITNMILDPGRRDRRP
ncbi:hotdog fold thioesterase [Citricoccus sp. SGAir0253]|uniref:hotdog fold thioesterase n=1 Tax=Citricoccus sp. SGAir0253 TaxID=2567881 RepID=UPI001FEE66A3|nr:hotdog fold thioesterase [Citricoccus sp. SGAir0253]